MEISEYIERDKPLLEVKGGALTIDTYAKLAFTISAASALVMLVLGVIGHLVNLGLVVELSHRIESQTNLPVLGMMAVGQFIFLYILLLLAYPFYSLLSRKIVKQSFVFKERG